MDVKINGQDEQVPENITIAEMVKLKGLTPEAIVIEHNEAICPREQWSNVTLSAGDNLEIVSFVGGG